MGKGGNSWQLKGSREIGGLATTPTPRNDHREGVSTNSGSNRNDGTQDLDLAAWQNANDHEASLPPTPPPLLHWYGVGQHTDPFITRPTPQSPRRCVGNNSGANQPNGAKDSATQHSSIANAISNSHPDSHQVDTSSSFLHDLAIRMKVYDNGLGYDGEIYPRAREGMEERLRQERQQRATAFITSLMSNENGTEGPYDDGVALLFRVCGHARPTIKSHTMMGKEETLQEGSEQREEIAHHDSDALVPTQTISSAKRSEGGDSNIAKPPLVTTWDEDGRTREEASEVVTRGKGEKRKELMMMRDHHNEEAVPTRIPSVGGSEGMDNEKTTLTSIALHADDGCDRENTLEVVVRRGEGEKVHHSEIKRGSSLAIVTDDEGDDGEEEDSTVLLQPYHHHLSRALFLRARVQRYSTLQTRLQQLRIYQAAEPPTSTTTDAEHSFPRCRVIDETVTKGDAYRRASSFMERNLEQVVYLLRKKGMVTEQLFHTYQLGN